MPSARIPLLLLAAVATAFATACAREAASPVPVDGREETAAWRAKHEADYRREWVTIAGLHFLTDGSQTAGSAKSNDIVLASSAPAALGRFVLADGRVS